MSIRVKLLNKATLKLKSTENYLVFRKMPKVEIGRTANVDLEKIRLTDPKMKKRPATELMFRLPMKPMHRWVWINSVSQWIMTLFLLIETRMNRSIHSFQLWLLAAKNIVEPIEDRKS